MTEPSGLKREQDVLSYLGQLGTNFLDYIIKRLSNPETASRNRLLLLITTAIILTLAILPAQHTSHIIYKTGEIARSDIRVASDQLVEDKALTEQRRKNAASKAPLVYSLSDQISAQLLDRVRKTVTIVASARSQEPPKTPSEWHSQLAPVLDTDLGEVEIAALLRIKSDEQLLASIEEELEALYENRVVLDLNLLKADLAKGIDVSDGNGRILEEVDLSTGFIDIADARKTVQRWSLKGSASSADSAIIATLVSRLLLPNFFHNREASEERARIAMETVKPVLFKLQKGEMIVRIGERISPEQSHKLQALFGSSKTANPFFKAVGTFAIIMVLFYFPYRFACKNIRKFNPTNKDVFLITTLTVVSFLFYKTSLLVTHSIGSVFPSIDPASYYYLLPFAAGAMILRIFINSEVSLVYCAITAPLLGIMFENSMLVVIYTLLSSLVGAHGVRHCSCRSTIYTAGLKVSVVSLALALSFQTFNDSLFTIQTLYICSFALFSGLFSAGIVSSFIPLIESLFQYTTDIKLLELANLNSPVLRELMVKAPGTYHHSVIVGNLVEAAAESIGANPLLARVAAYYHDIGKATKPQYFIENQAGEVNRHDKLTPSMSALILISHIKDGAELARENRLGQPIIDIIRQHHGTGLIKFFYERAKTQCAANGQSVEEKDFRYPGPKPQTREAGIVMLADCVEAASRTLANPTPDRIQGLVQKLINNVFMDGQLDECELTLKNLHEIAKSFTVILNGIFHHRIEYPEPAFKGSVRGRKVPLKVESETKTDADHDKKQSETLSGAGTADKNDCCENLKRLGMS